MSKKIFITGISSGLGEEFAKQYLAKGFKVYACSRSATSIKNDNLFFTKIDLSNLEDIHKNLSLLNMQNIDLAILNAGMIDDIKTMHNSSMDDINKVMNVNTFANKIILDFFIKSKIPLKQTIAISSGASINGHKGWGSYSLSKATLNMLIKLYADEMPNNHLVALAPGVIETKLVNKILNEADESEFKSVKHLRDCDKFSLKEAVLNIISNSDTFFDYDSGAYVDIREHIKNIH